MKNSLISMLFFLFLFLTVSVAADYAGKSKDENSNKLRAEVLVEEMSIKETPTKEVPVKEVLIKEVVKKEVVKKEMSKEEKEVKRLKERQARFDAKCEELLAYGPLIRPTSRGPHVWLGKKVKWCADNFVRLDGWQLSGWSKLLYDKNFNARRIKIGFITPELYGEEAIRRHGPGYSSESSRQWAAMTVESVFGVSIGWSF